jgi:hypothetical protein
MSALLPAVQRAPTGSWSGRVRRTRPGTSRERLCLGVYFNDQDARMARSERAVIIRRVRP